MEEQNKAGQQLFKFIGIGMDLGVKLYDKEKINNQEISLRAGSC